MDEAFNIILAYSKKGQELDEEAIKAIINSIVLEKGLQEYIESKHVVDKFGTGYVWLYVPAGYKADEKALYVSTLNMQHTSFVALNRYKAGDHFSIEEASLFKNIFSFHILLHELEHVNQTLIIDKGEGFEHDLLVLSEAYKISSNDTSNKYSPVERLAQIRSWETICTLLEPLKNAYPSIYDYAIDMKRKSITSFYEGNNGYIEEGPTYRFVKLGGHPRVLTIPWPIKDISELEKEFVDTEVRLIYGFPVPKDEYDSYKKR